MPPWYGHRLAGANATSSVRAVRNPVERLDRIRHPHQAGLAGRLLAIGRDTAARLPEPFRTVDHGDLLYDDRGRPA